MTSLFTLPPHLLLQLTSVSFAQAFKLIRLIIVWALEVLAGWLFGVVHAILLS